MYYNIIESPVGPILLAGDKEGLKYVNFLKSKGKDKDKDKDKDKGKVKFPDNWLENKEFFREITRQLDAYFSGELKYFDVKLAPEGTEFQKSVWGSLCKIPFGETRTYKDIAISIGKPKAYRAVGLANNRNPIAIIVPCHRVIGSDGKLTGYAGGLDVKEFLLKIEGSRRSQK
ncbi:MAG: methylated-DNA--[protein]-cysteine S-methyltransferase [Euryarchaeota archaeon]|nr:methylated-DNA--[protein]-cysteine S-methyltransferase [Euryarchaeota archaeon]